MISYSLKEITPDGTLLFAFMRFWLTGINGFVFPFGILGPAFCHEVLNHLFIKYCW